jgi:hypothetical protein
VCVCVCVCVRACACVFVKRNRERASERMSEMRFYRTFACTLGCARNIRMHELIRTSGCGHSHVVRSCTCGKHRQKSRPSADLQHGAAGAHRKIECRLVKRIARQVVDHGKMKVVDRLRANGQGRVSSRDVLARSESIMIYAWFRSVLHIRNI